MFALRNVPCSVYSVAWGWLPPLPCIAPPISFPPGPPMPLPTFDPIPGTTCQLIRAQGGTGPQRAAQHCCRIWEEVDARCGNRLVGGRYGCRDGFLLTDRPARRSSLRALVSSRGDDGASSLHQTSKKVKKVSAATRRGAGAAVFAVVVVVSCRREVGTRWLSIQIQVQNP